jgi:hypothetical protein
MGEFSVGPLDANEGPVLGKDDQPARLARREAGRTFETMRKAVLHEFMQH